MNEKGKLIPTTILPTDEVEVVDFNQHRLDRIEQLTADINNYIAVRDRIYETLDTTTLEMENERANLESGLGALVLGDIDE